MWEGQGGSSADGHPGGPWQLPKRRDSRGEELRSRRVRSRPPQCALDPLAEPRARVPILSRGVGSAWFFALLVPVQLDTLPQIPPGPAASRASER